jgi:putative membrane protein
MRSLDSGKVVMLQRLGSVALMVAALAGSLGIAAACTPEEEGDFGSPDTSLGTTEVPSDALTRIAVTVTDENIMALLDTTYDALIEIGEVAESQAADSLVRAAAADALVRHRQMRDENLALAVDINASPKLVEDEPIEGHAEALEQLRAQRGAQFDRAYLDRTIEVHESLLSEVRESLTMPVTERVRDHLERAAATLETDLRVARDAKAVIEAGGRS